MREFVLVSLAALGCWSCGQPCQQFFTVATDHAGQVAKLGAGSPTTVVVGRGDAPIVVSGMLPTGMQVEVDAATGKIQLTGTPTETGRFQAELRPQVRACVNAETTLANIVLDLTVVPAECEDALTCRLLKKGPCSTSADCTPTPPYAAAACIRTIGAAGVCVDVNGPNDGCSGAVAAMSVTTTESTQISTCVATPAITGCNHHVCYGAP
ncbi:MAG: hypothetical protein U0228_22800 [Myxococcaceae bacterium]